MSEEEKKAIKTLKEVASDDFDTLGDDISPKMAQNILNVIDKQKKEIEELKKEIEELKKDRKDNMQVIYGGRRFGTEGMVLKDYISKDKIREKIKEARKIRWHIPKLVIEYFDELLEEE